MNQSPENAESTKQQPRPYLLFADVTGNIYDHDELYMLARKGLELGLARPDELSILPQACNLFYLPATEALALDPDTGELVILEELAVSALVPENYILTASPAYSSLATQTKLPALVYASVGFMHGKIYVCAQKLAENPYELNLSGQKLKSAIQKKGQNYIKNPLISYLLNVLALEKRQLYALNFLQGKGEIQIPLFSAEDFKSPVKASLGGGLLNPPIAASLTTKVNAEDVLELMNIHAQAEKAIISFGLATEPCILEKVELLKTVLSKFKANKSGVLVNLNTFGLKQKELLELAPFIDKLTVYLNSSQDFLYKKLYGENNLGEIAENLMALKAQGVSTGLCLQYFSGVTDSEREIVSLMEFMEKTQVSYLQLKNLNIDPNYYLELCELREQDVSLGFKNFKRRITKGLPQLKLLSFLEY